MKPHLPPLSTTLLDGVFWMEIMSHELWWGFIEGSKLMTPTY
jgi:hypothetical protein